MDYEKKKRLVELRDSMKSYGYMDGVEELEDIFPELKKNEDERIRKWLYDYISNCPNNNFAFYGGVGKDAVLNYLEKQKPAEWSEEDEDTLGDAISAADILGNDESFNNGNPHLAKAFRVAKDWLKSLPQRFNLQPKNEWSEDYREEDLRTRFAFYTYKNEEDDDVLYLSNVFVEETSRNKGFGTKILMAAEKVAETLGATRISLKVKQDSPANAWYRKHGYGYIAFEGDYDWLEKTLEYMKPVKSKWGEEDETMLETILSSYKYLSERWVRGEFRMDLGTPSPSESAIKDSEEELNWLKSLPERFNPHPKQEWSEEDEKMLKAFLHKVEVCDLLTNKENVWILKKLKSLHP